MYASRLRKEVFKSCRKLSNKRIWSRTVSGNKFQAIRPATEKVRLPNIEHWRRGMNSWWQIADSADRQCRRVECSVPSGTVKLWTTETGGQLCKAWTALAEEHLASAAPRVEDETGIGRTCSCHWRCPRRHSVLAEACRWWTWATYRETGIAVVQVWTNVAAESVSTEHWNRLSWWGMLYPRWKHSCSVVRSDDSVTPRKPTWLLATTVSIPSRNMTRPLTALSYLFSTWCSWQTSSCWLHWCSSQVAERQILTTVQVQLCVIGKCMKTGAMFQDTIFKICCVWCKQTQTEHWTLWYGAWDVDD